MLNINWSTLLFQVLNFVVMVFVLWRFLFKPVIRILDERSLRVTRALDDAEQREREAQDLRVEYEEKLAQGQEQVVVMRQQAQEELAQTKRQILNETRQEITAMRDKAESEIQESRQQAIYQHRHELGRLITVLSARMIRESTGETFQQASIEKFIDRLAALPVEDYRQTLGEGEVALLHAQLVSAQELDTGDAARIEEMVRHVADQPIEVIYKVDGSLIAGASVRFGDVVIDGSVAGQLENLKERYTAELEQSEA
jgi:F-type H+-transporting ATPase subunit b